jgi:hypothetical protein
MLSGSEASRIFSHARQKILRLSPQDDIATQFPIDVRIGVMVWIGNVKIYPTGGRSEKIR